MDTVVKEQGCGRHSVIHFGCGTGVNCFLLTKVFEKVTGVDYSGRFLDAAIAIQHGKPVQYGERKVAAIPEGTNSNKVLFKQVKVDICFSL